MNEKENFIEAIREDAYAEMHLNAEKSVYLITDTQFDGTFLPYVGANNTDNWTEQEISDLMVRNDVDDIFSWHRLEWSEGNDVWYPIVERCEYEEREGPFWE